jgi:GT2 family glycosyltransferase
MSKKRALIGSSVCQKPNILAEFLKSLAALRGESVTLDICLIDDNQDAASKELLDGFDRDDSQVIIQQGAPRDQKYWTDDNTHYWSNDLILRITEYKNGIIDYAAREDYDYLFFADSDLVLHPNLIQHLITTGKDIISEIFWTRWTPNSTPLPNVWMYDHYAFAHPRLDAAAQAKIQQRFLTKLKTPGVYEVGGLGACTLLSREVLRYVSFSPIKNISFMGEDRAFCVRAAAFGFELYVDTHYPAFHIYREADLERLRKTQD